MIHYEKKWTHWSKFSNQFICRYRWNLIELIIWKSIEFIFSKSRIVFLWTKFSINCINKIKWNEREIWFFFDYFVFVIWKTVIKNEKSVKKKTSSDEHLRTEQNNNQRCLFHINSDRHYCSHCWLQIYFSYWRNGILSSVKSQIRKSL